MMKKFRRFWSKDVKKIQRMQLRRRWLKFYDGKFPKPRIPMPKFILELWEKRNVKMKINSCQALRLRRYPTMLSEESYEKDNRPTSSRTQ